MKNRHITKTATPNSAVGIAVSELQNSIVVLDVSVVIDQQLPSVSVKVCKGPKALQLEQDVVDEESCAGRSTATMSQHTPTRQR